MLGRACQEQPAECLQVHCTSWARAWAVEASAGLASWRVLLCSLATNPVPEHVGAKGRPGFEVLSLPVCSPLSTYNREVEYPLGPGPSGAALGLPKCGMIQTMWTGSVGSDLVGSVVLLD